MPLKGFKLLLLSLLVSGCSYRLGEPAGLNWDRPIHLAVLGNKTLYPDLTQDLRRYLAESLKAEQGPRLGQRDSDALVIGGKLLDVEKSIFEKDSFGRPTELQFQLTFQLEWQGKKRTIANTDLKHSSGLFRPYDGRLRSDDAGRSLSENQALDEALSDLAQVILLEIRRSAGS